MSKNQIIVQQTIVTLTRVNESDFISLTDIARVKNASEPKDVVKNWLRSRSTIDFLGLWEKINNPQFKGVEFDALRNEAGTNSFTLSPNKHVNRGLTPISSRGHRLAARGQQNRPWANGPRRYPGAADRIE